MDSLKNNKGFVLVSMFVLVLIIAMGLYLKPMALSNILSDQQEISLLYIEMGVQDGEVYMNTDEVQTLLLEQKKSLLDITDQYQYRRQIDTIWSDGSMSNLGNTMAQLYVYQDDCLADTIMISSNNQIVINDKTYHTANATDLIAELAEIL